MSSLTCQFTDNTILKLYHQITSADDHKELQQDAVKLEQRFNWMGLGFVQVQHAAHHEKDNCPTHTLHGHILLVVSKTRQHWQYSNARFNQHIDSIITNCDKSESDSGIPWEIKEFGWLNTHVNEWDSVCTCVIEWLSMYVYILYVCSCMHVAMYANTHVRVCALVMLLLEMAASTVLGSLIPRTINPDLKWSRSRQAVCFVFSWAPQHLNKCEKKCFSYLTDQPWTLSRCHLIVHLTMLYKCQGQT